MDSVPLRIELFGVPRATLDGAEVRVDARPLCVVLLAMLALAPERRVSRAQLAGDLWPDEGEAAAGANLRRHLSLLKAAFPAGSDWIQSDRTTVRLANGLSVWCDVVAFERGELERYESDFMAGHTHEWALTKRERLRAKAVDALQQRTVGDRESDDYEAAVDHARRAVELDPLNETSVQILIELCGERGDIDGLNGVFSAFAQRLERDVDAQPNQTTIELVERFRHASATSAIGLPMPLTSFVGGAGALAEVSELIGTHRLVSLVGTGGIGKTRLALEVARNVASSFVDGTYFVDLSSVVQGDAIPSAILRALAVPTGIASRGFDGLRAFLQNRRALIVLDNCEQVVDACAWLVDELLQAAPRVAVLATTREPLGLTNERLWRLLPLDLTSAAALFLDRAHGIAKATTADEEAIGRICERLDCLPLAIELAAGLTATLSVQQLHENLDDRFAILRSRDRTAPSRHRTLENVIEWSFELLTPSEREAFSKLPVFNGSFTLKAAHAVCGSDTATILALIEKSMLAHDDRFTDRYRLLYSIGEFAADRFSERDDLAALCDVHAAYYEKIAGLSGDRTEREFGNVVGALKWTLLRRGSREAGIRLTIASARYFETRGYYADGAFWIETAVEHARAESEELGRLVLARGLIERRRENYERCAADMAAAARIFEALNLEHDAASAMSSLSGALLWLDRLEESDRLIDRALELAVACGNARAQAMLIANRGFLCTRRGERGAARAHYERAIPLFGRAGDQAGVAKMINNLAASDFLAGHYKRAEEYLTRALAILRLVGDPEWLAQALSDLGDVATMQALHSKAREYYAETLDLSASFALGYPRERAIAGFAALAAAAARAADAARLLGASRSGRRRGVDPEADTIVFRHAKELALATLSAEEFAREETFGATLDREAVSDLVRSIT